MKAIAWAIPLVFLCAATEARAQERYYVLVFGAQTVPNQPKKAHTFATFVKVCPQPCGCCCIDDFTISWVPASLEVHTYLIGSEPGANISLEESIDYALVRGDRISLWGPYEIKPALYERARKEKERLESGRVRYKAVINLRPLNRVTNCIDSLSSFGVNYGRRVFSPSWGETASYHVTHRFHRWIIHCRCTHDWLIGYLGLDCLPMIRRSYHENPRSGVIWGLIRRNY